MTHSWFVEGVTWSPVLAVTSALVLSGCSSEPGQSNPWVDAQTDGTTVTFGTDSSGLGSTLPSSSSTVANVDETSTGSVTSTPSASSSVSTSDTQVADEQCASPSPGRSPLRRLTRFEFSNTLESLLADTTNAGQELPAELLGNGFANDADSQPASAFLIEQYANVAADVAARALALGEGNARIDACVFSATPELEAACFQTFLAEFGPRAYRRPLSATEIDELGALQQNLRSHGDFRSSVQAVIEAMLQTPDFLYRFEFGEPAEAGRLRPTGAEMATRLSYFLWGTSPDDELSQAAASGQLVDAAGVLKQAERLLGDPKARRLVQFFFDNYLPINALSDQTRDPLQFPSFNAEVGALMYQETWRFLENEIFSGGGTWDSVLTAPYTFVNEPLANFYGFTGVVGEEFRKVDVNASQRLGLLTQAGMMTGTTVTNVTNPVRRGGFLLSQVLCVEVPLPPAELAARATPPEPYTGSTGRERYTKHSQDEVCATCHALLDPPGFAFENFDAVGQWRDQENDVTIDASGELALLGKFAGPVELVQLIAGNAATHACFASKWQTFAYGRKLDADDACNRQTLDAAFAASGHNVQRLLLDITQTDGFLYLGASE